MRLQKGKSLRLGIDTQLGIVGVGMRPLGIKLLARRGGKIDAVKACLGKGVYRFFHTAKALGQMHVGGHLVKGAGQDGNHHEVRAGEGFLEGIGHLVLPLRLGVRMGADLAADDAVAPGLLVRENEFGERFAVLPFTGDPLKKFTANYDRARQLRRVFSYIARRPLPLTVQETAPYIWLLLNRTADNRLVAGVLNCSSDTIEELPLLAGSEFAKGIVQITCDGEKNIPLVSEVIPDPDGTGAILFNLKMTLKPLDFALLAAVE